MRKRSEMTRFIYFSFAACLFISVILSGCSKEPAIQEASKEPTNTGPTPGGTLKVIVLDNVTNLGYPAEQRVSSSLYFVQPVLETLGRYNEKSDHDTMACG